MRRHYSASRWRRNSDRWILLHHDSQWSPLVKFCGRRCGLKIFRIIIL